MESVREPVTKLVTVDVVLGIRTYWVLGKTNKANEGQHFLK